MRSRLLAAARRLVGGAGLGSLSAAKLAQEAGVSRTTFYQHFSSKRACAAEAIDPVLGEIERQVSEVDPARRPWAGVLRGAIDLAIERELHNPEAERASFFAARPEVLTAVFDLVADRGYDATRLVDVAAAAGVSRARLSSPFRSKREWFAAAYAMRLAELEAAVWAASDPPGVCPGAQRIDALLDRLAADPRVARVLVVEAGRLPAEPTGEALADATALPRLIECLIFERVAMHPDPWRRMVVGGVLELLRSAAQSGRPARIRALAPELGELAEQAREWTPPTSMPRPRST